MLEELRGLLAELIGWIPEAAMFLLVLLVGLVVAWLVKRGIDAVLTRLRASSWVERLSLRAVDRPIRVDVANILASVVYWVLVLLTLYFAFGVFGKDTVIAAFLGGLIFTLLPKLFVAAIIVVLAAAVAGAVSGIIEGALGGSRLGRTLGNAAGVVILVLGVVAALAEVGIATAVVLPLFYAVLFALVVGVGVAFGVGGIPVARRLLEDWTGQAEALVDEIRDDVNAADEVPAAPAADLEPPVVPVDENVVAQATPKPRRSRKSNK